MKEKQKKGLWWKEGRWATENTHQCYSQIKEPTLTVHEVNAVLIPGIQVEVVVHAKSPHMIQSVLAVF